mmetsp:Transcript_22495/g.44584  ORF Transcript_22495/g.44584 Transcript_22495/m.44584 type:complete len:223 (-) Transcript_22495:273-941(-)|eukprot:CAMPEP_0175149948 /NCGR_PEP_ID=MMETSP0087-20121206/17565_1 /TAXON_ID=136419 /ORGANISM="Unknown Unknown, Strain D1" /LENGTH=222 /DNA_ID=CAMNT_0016435773 /DNA_START=92 /DNA_END=760 /DNA_ORIENTATION=+
MGVCSTKEKKAPNQDLENLTAQIEELKALQRHQAAEVALSQQIVLTNVKHGDSAAMVSMWSLLAKSVVAGVSVSPEQLEVLWGKYDKDQNGVLDLEEVKCMLEDVRLSRIQLLENALSAGSPFREQNRGNPIAFAALEQEMKSKLYSLQSEQNSFDEHEVKSIFSNLDVNGDGKIQKTEFLCRAEETIFSEQRQARQVVDNMIQSLEMIQNSVQFDVCVTSR